MRFFRLFLKIVGCFCKFGHIRILQMLVIIIQHINCNKYKYTMIELYAIINQGQPMECYVHEEKYRKEMEMLLNYILKKIKLNSSKTVKSLLMNSYQIYYFSQATFIFILATQTNSKPERMQNYLRVVADIFYQNYDQKKFRIVLQRIMAQINRTEFGIKKSQTTFIQDEESFLVLSNSNFHEQKKKINMLIQKQQPESKFPKILVVLLIIIILILCIVYIDKKWL